MNPLIPSRTIVIFGLLTLAATLAGCSSGGGSDNDPIQRRDTNSVNIPAGKGVEFKLFARQGDAFDYSWSTSRAVNYDFHGEREGDKSGAFTSHKKGTAAADTGKLTAPFTGTHGWWWENRSTGAVTVSLTTNGVYDIVGEIAPKR